MYVSKWLRYVCIFLVGLLLAIFVPVIVFQEFYTYDPGTELVSQPVTPSFQELPDIRLIPLGECSVGCWQGLQSGETTETEVNQFLENPSLEIFRIDPEYNNTITIWATHEDGYTVVAVISEGVLYRIEISALWLRLTLGEIIAALGEPSYKSVVYSIADDELMYQIDLTVYYPSQGFAFRLFDTYLRDMDGITTMETQNGDIEVCLSEWAIVSVVEITQAGSINDMLEYTNFPSERTPFELDEMMEWSGFGCVHLSQP